MSKVKVYEFFIYDIKTDDNQKSRRWGTREGIKAIGGTVLENTETEINDTDVGGEIAGLTERGFNPHSTFYRR